MSESLQDTMATNSAPRRHLQVVHPATPTPVEAAPVKDPVTPPTWAQRLSNREVEVLHCIATGLSTTEIAQTLFISTATVKSHIARLIMKVEVRDRIQLVVEAYRTGFIRLS